MLAIEDKKKINKTWKRAFILQLREHGIPALAAKQIGIRIHRVAQAKKDDPRFLEYFNEALQMANADLEYNARLQAMSGSERIMIKLLEGNIPEKYAKVEQNTNNTFVKAYIGFSPDLWDQPAVDGELIANDTPLPELVEGLENVAHERDPDDSDVSAVALADQTVAG